MQALTREGGRHVEETGSGVEEAGKEHLVAHRGDAPMKTERSLLAAALMVVAAFLNSLDAVIVRTLAGEVHPLMIGFFAPSSAWWSCCPGCSRGLI